MPSESARRAPGLTVLDPAVVASLASSGPRYTSYPPATAFAPLDEGVVQAELTRLGADQVPLGLYLHVPFCRSLCWYCGCNVIPTRDASRGEGYVDDILRELAALRRRIGCAAPLHEISLGGGSPNFLTVPALQRLVEAIRATFAVAPDARWSIELDPRTTAAAQVAALAELGFRSASLGVQDFDLEVQDTIHRHQTYEQTAGLMQELRAAGFDDLNVDLVYGLPQQTETSLAATVDAVIALAPDRIALFGYAHLPDRLPHQRLVERKGPLPDAQARAAQFLRTRDALGAAGYVAIGLDHFARAGSGLARAAAAGQLSRNFQGYVERRVEATLGLGASAISSTPRLHWQAPVDLEAWKAALTDDRIPLARGVAIDADDQLRGRIIEALMCDGVVDLGALRAATPGPTPPFDEALAALAASPLVTLDRTGPEAALGPRVIATDLGRILIRNVCVLFDRHARTGTHSSTI